MPPPIALNLARIVHRLLTTARGWRVDLLQEELEIADRTWRKYRKLLLEMPELQDAEGRPLVAEVVEGEAKYLRLVGGADEHAVSNDLITRVAVLQLLQDLFHTWGHGELSSGVQSLLSDFESRVADRPFVLGHVLRNVDRLFHAVAMTERVEPPDPDVLVHLLRGLVHSRVVAFDYDSASSERRRVEVRPLSLVTYRDALYLRCRRVEDDGWRTYAVARILAPVEQGASFDYPSRRAYDPAKQLGAGWGIFLDDTPPSGIELILDDNTWLKRYVAERRWHPTQQSEEMADGRLRVTMHAPVVSPLVAWVRSFGDAVEVVGPEELRAQV